MKCWWRFFFMHYIMTIGKCANNMIWGNINQRWYRNISIFKSPELNLVFNVYNENDDRNTPFNTEDKIIFHLSELLEPGHMFDEMYSYYENTNSHILSLLRCLNMPRILRLISVLRSEKNIILVSNNITKLSPCVRGTIAILVQGLLIWKHI